MSTEKAFKQIMKAVDNVTKPSKESVSVEHTLSEIDSLVHRSNTVLFLTMKGLLQEAGELESTQSPQMINCRATLAAAMMIYVHESLASYLALCECSPQELAVILEESRKAANKAYNKEKRS